MPAERQAVKSWLPLGAAVAARARHRLLLLLRCCRCLAPGQFGHDEGGVKAKQLGHLPNEFGKHK